MSFTCSDCGKSFGDASALRSHSSAKRHGEFRRPFCCPDCDKSYLTADVLRTHQEAKQHGSSRFRFGQTMHTKPTVFVPTSQPETNSATTIATAVGISTASASSTVSATAHPPSEPALCKCTICDLSFTSQSEMEAHHGTSFVHPSCGKCGISFHDKSELSQHVRESHEAVVCVCGIIVKVNELPAHYLGSPRHLVPVQVSQPAPSTATARSSSQTITGSPAAVRPDATVDGNDGTESVTSLTFSSIGSEEEDIPVEKAEAHPRLDQLQTELRPAIPHWTMQWMPSEDHQADDSDGYACIESVQRLSEDNVHASQGIPNRPDSVISYLTDNDLDCEARYIGTSANPAESTVLQASVSLAIGGNSMPAPYPIGSRVAAYYPALPSTDVCIRSDASSRLSTPAPSHVLPCSPLRRASPSFCVSDTSEASFNGAASTSAQSRTSQHVSSVTASTSIATGHPALPPSVSAARTHSQGKATGPSWHCRVCEKDPCEDPTATQCGHIFCYRCIVKEIAEKMKCPVCNRMFLLKLHAY